MKWSDQDYETLYYLYSLFLYEDQDGRLYDTERLDVLAFDGSVEPGSPPVVNDGDTISWTHPNLISEGSFLKEVYRFYSKEDKGQLIQAFRQMEHPLADVLSVK